MKGQTYLDVNMQVEDGLIQIDRDTDMGQTDRQA